MVFLKVAGSVELAIVSISARFNVIASSTAGLIASTEILSKAGEICKINADGQIKVSLNGQEVQAMSGDGYIEFNTEAGQRYHLEYLAKN